MHKKSDPRIIREFVDLARERGTGLSRQELRAAGYTDGQIDANCALAANELRAVETRRVA